MIVCKVQVKDCNGPCVYRDAKHALEEIEMLIGETMSYPPGITGVNDTITVSFGFMDEDEFAALDEFMGY